MRCYKLNAKHGLPLKAGNIGTMLLVIKESGSLPVGLKSKGDTKHLDEMSYKSQQIE